MYPEQDIPDTPEIHAAAGCLMATPDLHGRPTKPSIIDGTWKIPAVQKVN